MIEIIKDKNQWIKQLALVQHLDFYHTYDYHHLSKKANESPILIKYSDGHTSLLLPLLLRDIENSDYKDATSVYGYVGVLAQSIGENFKKENFHKDLTAFFIANKIISVFSRLHPYLESEESILEGLGTITELGKVVYINLSDSLEEQRKMFNRRLKSYLNKSRKSCTVIEGDKNVHLDAFIELYHENMRRVGADDSYFFDNNYFQEIMSSKTFDYELMLCRLDETQEIIAGAIFFKKGNIVQYHLSGLNSDFYALNPIKLIIDEMRINATEKGFKYFNLGGGKDSNEDTLFMFKRTFSKNFKTFKIWKYIVNEVVYNEMTKNHLKTLSKTDVENTVFFPAYRSK